MNDDRSAFLAARLTGLGGTDAAGALGIGKWKSELGIYLEKRGEAPPQDDNPAMYWGRTLEPVVRDEYIKRAGVGVVYGQPLSRSLRYPWMIANLDGRRRDDGRVVEIKTARSGDEWGEPGSADVPADYVCQVMHYMVVTEAPVADIAVLIGGSDFRTYTVPFDAEMAEMIIDAERELWDRIQRGEPPAPRTAADVAAMYRVAKAQEIEAPAAIHETVERLRAIRDGIKSAEADADALETAIKLQMAGADTLTYGGKVLATWKQRAGATRLDSKALKVALPDIYNQFARTSEPTRTFLLKGTK